MTSVDAAVEAELERIFTFKGEQRTAVKALLSSWLSLSFCIICTTKRPRHALCTLQIASFSSQSLHFHTGATLPVFTLPFKTHARSIFSNHVPSLPGGPCRAARRFRKGAKGSHHTLRCVAVNVRMLDQSSLPRTKEKQPCAVSNRLYWHGRNLTGRLEFDRQLVCLVNFGGFYFEGASSFPKAFRGIFPRWMHGKIGVIPSLTIRVSFH